MPCRQCCKPWPFGRPPYLGGTLMKCVIHRLERSPDNVGHWQSSVALVVPLGRVSARLRKEPASTFGKSKPRPRKQQSRPEIETGIRDVLNDLERFDDVRGPRPSGQIHGSTNYPMMFRGTADRCWVHHKSRSLNGYVRVPAREPGKLG